MIREKQDFALALRIARDAARLSGWDVTGIKYSEIADWWPWKVVVFVCLATARVYFTVRGS